MDIQNEWERRQRLFWLPWQDQLPEGVEYATTSQNKITHVLVGGSPLCGRSINLETATATHNTEGECKSCRRIWEQLEALHDVPPERLREIVNHTVDAVARYGADDIYVTDIVRQIASYRGVRDCAKVAAKLARQYARRESGREVAMDPHVMTQYLEESDMIDDGAADVEALRLQIAYKYIRRQDAYSSRVRSALMRQMAEIESEADLAIIGQFFDDIDSDVRAYLEVA